MELTKNTTYEEIKNNWGKFEWEDSFLITGISRGRSAAHFNAKSEKSGRHFTVFMIDLFDMLKNGDFRIDRVSGIFIIKKRGTSYGIRLKYTPIHKGDD